MAWWSWAACLCRLLLMKASSLNAWKLYTKDHTNDTCVRMYVYTYMHIYANDTENNSSMYICMNKASVHTNVHTYISTCKRSGLLIHTYVRISILCSYIHSRFHCHTTSTMCCTLHNKGHSVPNRYVHVCRISVWTYAGVGVRT